MRQITAIVVSLFISLPIHSFHLGMVATTRRGRSANTNKIRPHCQLGSSLSETGESKNDAIASDLELLTRAAETKQEDSDAVLEALLGLERNMKKKAKEDPSVAQDTLVALTGDWRLIFTTGTIDTQKRTGRINYFPIKAVQSFRTNVDPMLIENGIYVGDFCLVKFSGEMEFNLVNRKLEFDFDNICLLQFLDVKLKKGEAAKIGSSTGLGSESNVQNAKKGKKAFFNWISADANIATARGGGGGIALWKRNTAD